MQNNFVTLGCPGKLTSGPWHSTTHGGGALDNSICPKKPISLHFKGQPIDPQIRSGSKKQAKWCSACGSWFCIWLFMVLHPAPALFQAKTELWDLPNKGKVQHKDYRHGNAFVQAQLVECLKYLHQTRLINETPTAEQEIGLQPCQLLNSFPKRSHGLKKHRIL